MALDTRRILFAHEYIKDLCGAAAARRIGISDGSARSEACRMLAEPEVKDLIADLIEERKATAKIDAEQVLAELVALTLYDPIHAYDERTNTLKPLHEMPVAVRKALVGVDVFQEFEGKGEDREHIGDTVKVRFADRGPNFDRLMKHLGMLKDTVKIEGAVELIERLARGRKRVSPEDTGDDLAG